MRPIGSNLISLGERMDVLKDRPQCPSGVVGAIVDLVRVALARAGTPAQVDIDDLEHLVDVLHLLRPDSAEFAFFDGWLHMVREEWSDAERLFRNLVERSVCLPASKGMLLQCLKARQEFGWQEEARHLLEEGGNEEVERLAKVLLASEELKQAVATAKRTGRFVAPDSALAFENGAHAEDGEAVATPSSSSSDMLLTMQYMRV
ncbi:MULTISPECIES: HrpB1 family type III secretion system apparatus protein [Burkholderia]|uniref:HrpB1 family type III secretion system apparatus protein n=1 Tax=Burkholderia sola TaxID=2843302 RepID=A0ABV2CDS2_9BURK